jgi:hypothetical protein
MLCKCATLKYLGMTVVNQNYTQKDFKSIPNSINSCYYAVQNHMPFCLLSKNVII